MLSYRILVGCLVVTCVAGIVFGITGRFAVRQITHDNMAAIKAITAEVYTNSLPESRADIYKLEAKLYKRVALSSVRESWKDICTVALWLGVLAGIAALLVFRRGKNIQPTA